MAESERADSGHPLISNPKEFLAKPFVRLEVGKLMAPPNLELLTWMPSLKDEAGLVLVEPDWFIIKASSRGVPSFLLPKSSDTLLHSHPFSDEDKHDEGSVPSLGDFVNCSQTAKNLIVSSFGITQYWFVEDRDKRRNLEAELNAFSPRFNDRKSNPDYLKFLEENDARYRLYSWDGLNEEGVEELL
ncbi:MAG: hypothetical protein U1E54_01170 [Candidatus Levybacteria bacterium]|nr:hypothetical protein [Candidatus Levybacteria bacterium]